MKKQLDFAQGNQGDEVVQILGRDFVNCLCVSVVIPVLVALIAVAFGVA